MIDSLPVSLIPNPHRTSTTTHSRTIELNRQQYNNSNDESITIAFAYKSKRVQPERTVDKLRFI